MLKSEAAAYLAGVTQTEGAEASAPTNLHVITGEVGEMSEDGKALIKIDGLVFSESNDQYIEIDALGGLEEGDIATLILSGEQGHAMTPLAIGSIGSIDRITVRIAAIEADYIKVEQLDAAKARIGELEADHVSVDDLDAATARIGTLETTRATITELEAATARIHSLEVDHVTVDNFEAATARIGELESDHVSTDDLEAATGRIGQLEADTADIDTIRANSAKVQNLTAAELEADHATIGALDTNYAHITNGVIDNATIGYADVNNLSAHYAEIQNGKIDSALINTAAIVDEQVFTVTGNKATISQIDASRINVLNLRAQDIEVERINGQPVSGKTLVDALTQHESDISDLDTKIDDEVEALNERIDGAIETFTGTVVPTLSNEPASSWNTDILKDQHVGDVYYVVNDQSAQNGYCYRFTKSGSTYSWQLIKDSDVTAALSRLQTAEGKIGDIETFDETVGSFMTSTDDEISSLKIKDTQLETSLGDKVDTTTFNTVSQKVDTNEANITSMSTVLTNNGLTSSTNITNTVNTVKQTADTNTASITSLTQTVNNKADSTTVTTLTNRVSTVEQNLSGITTRVANTESELDTVSNPNLSPYFSACQNTDFFTNANYPIVSSEIGTIGTQLSDGWLHVDMDNSARTSAAYLNTWLKKPSWVKNSTGYTWLIEVRNFTLTSGSYIRFSPAQSNSAAQTNATGYKDVTADGSYYVKSTTKADATTNSAYTTFSRGLIQANAGANASFDVRYSVYEGDYSGPYKPYVEQTLVARMRSAETTIEQTANNVLIKATQNDTTAAQGGQHLIESLINVAPSGVKIQASKVEIDGTAVFSAISSDVDNAITSKGYATTAQAQGYADAIQVGGRNLLRGTDTGTGWSYSSFDASARTFTRETTATSEAYVQANSASYLMLELGVDYTLSCWAKSNGQVSSMDMYCFDQQVKNVISSTNLALTTSWEQYVFTFRYDSWASGSSPTGFTIRFDNNGSKTSGTNAILYIREPKLEKGNKATDWTPAPEDVTANAVKRTQRIWYRTNASSAPATPGTASSNWVTKADDGNDAWTKMHIAISSTHKYIYTCEQYEMANGTVGYTSVLLDNTITVIDGGNIITGTVTANKLNAADINASKSLTVGAMTDAAASTILNSNIQVGARNLLQQSWRETQSSVTKSGITYTCNPDGSITLDGTSTAQHVFILAQSLTLSAGTYTFSGCPAGGGTNSYRLDILSVPLISGTTASVPDSGNGMTFETTGGTTGQVRIRVVSGQTLSNLTFWPKLEKGNKATDWSPAPEDMATAEYADSVAYQVAQPNLSPFFSMSGIDIYNASTNPSGYWQSSFSSNYITILEDGWAHVSASNTGSSYIFCNFFTAKDAVPESFKTSTKYTLLVETRNVTVSGSVAVIATHHYASQLHAFAATASFNVTGAESRYLSVTSASDISSIVLFTRGYVQVAAGASIEMDIRISLYEGEYTGPYKPYTGSQLYATNSALAGTNESLEGAIEDIGDLSDQLVGTTAEQNKTITDIQTYLNSLRRDLDAEIQSRQQWLNFNSAEGLVIGAAGSTFKTVTTNTSQQFRSGGTVLAETSGAEFVAPVMRSDQLLIGNWMWTRRDNGNLSLKWIG